MARPGPQNALTDVPGLTVGCAEDAAVRSGVTVIVPDAPAVCAVDVRGGGPGTRETDALAAENLVDAVDAVVLSGGSVYGLAAADGVTAALGAAGRGFSLRPEAPRAPIVPAAILYDLANGGDKAWGADPPYRRLAVAAFAQARAQTPLGKVGAGYGARAGAIEGGQGTASVVLSAGEIVAALACVNCWGSALMPGQAAFWAWPFEQDGEFGAVAPDPARGALDLDDWGAWRMGAAPRANTTLALVATDAALTPAQAKRVAQMASAGLARAIRPAFAPFDGDVVFALSTGRRAAPDPMALARIGAAAADCAARAVARGVYAATQTTGLPTWRSLLSQK
ncbi:MAG: P1 family peptidase [Hyphomonadaceae bacterium]|nr:P1 family peptidase [Hyphomonadaceae bacterium]